MKTIKTAIQLLIGLTLAVVLVACGKQQPPPGDEVIIPQTTKVAEPSTRAALTHFDRDSGVMRFSANTPFLQNLRVDDVLVSEPSAAAPYGYLRKVRAIRREGGEVVLETVQANITDAITQGGLEQEGEFTAEDVASTAVYLQGVTAGAVPVREGVAPQVGVGENLHFRIGFNQVVLNLGEGDVKAEVRMNGEFSFNAGWGVHLRIRPCLDVPPVCVKSFEAKIGMEERLNVKISGEANAKLKKEIKVASYYFKPKVFFIGPVPVVVTSKVEVFVGASGEIKLKFSYGVTQSARAQLGARWTPKHDWQNISGFGVNLEGHDQFKLEGAMNAKAYVRGLASLKLYDVAGPAMGLILSAEIDAAIPRNPTWIARAGIEGYLAFVVGLPVIGTLKEYRTTLFKESIDLLRSPNQAPRFSNVVTGAIRVDLRRPVYLGAHSGFVRGQFDVLDPEGDPFTLTAVSHQDGTVTLPQQGYVFTTQGPRGWTVTARDSHGASASVNLNFDVFNTPPRLWLETPLGSVHQGELYVMSALVTDINEPDPSRLCPNTTWSVDPPATLSATTGCGVKVTFNAQGSHTVRVSTRDTEGAPASDTGTVSVQPPPANPFPRILDFGAYERKWITDPVVGCVAEPLGFGRQIDLRATACPDLVTGRSRNKYYAEVEVENPSGEALTYDWRLIARLENGQDEEITSNLGSSSPTFELRSPSNHGDLRTESCRVTVRVNAPDPSRSKDRVVWNGYCTYLKPAPGPR